MEGKEKPIDRAMRLQREQASKETGMGNTGTPGALAGAVGAAAAQGTWGTQAEPCASCGEKCCNRFAVPITGFDLVRMVRKLQCDPTEFAVLDQAEYIQSAPHSAVFIFDKEGKMEERLLTLRRLKTNYCIFSRHSNGCAIWGYHPMACRAYPFAFKGKDAKGNDLIGYTRNLVCPRKWEKNEWQAARVRAILESMELELAGYNKIVREWNAEHAKKGHEKEFFAFLIEKSEKQMRVWEKEKETDPAKMGSLGPKRGFIQE
jgi:Fe-S-cluster containining protein